MVAPDTLAHGRSLNDVHRAAQAAARMSGLDAVSYADRYDEARSAIVEALYTCPHPPSDLDLLRAGREALFRVVREHRHHHGYDQRAQQRGSGTSVMFQRYWMSSYSPSPEREVVERLSLGQIFPRLSPQQREVVTALALHDGDVDVAAARLNLRRETFIGVLNQGRARFRQWWHEGETPSRMWRRDYHAARPCGVSESGDRCPAGHVRSPENTYVSPKGVRGCRPCRNRWMQARRARARVGGGR